MADNTRRLSTGEFIRTEDYKGRTYGRFTARRDVLVTGWHVDGVTAEDSPWERVHCSCAWKAENKNGRRLGWRTKREAQAFADRMNAGEFMDAEAPPRKRRPMGGYRKIDIYVRGTKAAPWGRYLASTNSARNLKEARENYAMRGPGGYAASDLRAEYA